MCRPDKVVPAVQDFVEAQLGRKFVEPPTFDLKACHADSTPVTPLIFVLSAGSDPTAALLQFAAEKDMSSRSLNPPFHLSVTPYIDTNWTAVCSGRHDRDWLLISLPVHLAPT